MKQLRDLSTPIQRKWLNKFLSTHGYYKSAVLSSNNLVIVKTIRGKSGCAGTFKNIVKATRSAMRRKLYRNKREIHNHIGSYI